MYICYVIFKLPNIPNAKVYNSAIDIFVIEKCATIETNYDLLCCLQINTEYNYLIHCNIGLQINYKKLRNLFIVVLLKWFYLLKYIYLFLSLKGIWIKCKSINCPLKSIIIFVLLSVYWLKWIYLLYFLYKNGVRLSIGRKPKIGKHIYLLHCFTHSRNSIIIWHKYSV